MKRILIILVTLFLICTFSFAQQTITSYTWNNNLIEDWNVSIQGFKWGMTQPEILKILGATSDRDNEILAYENKPVFDIFGEVNETGTVYLEFTNAKLSLIKMKVDHLSDLRVTIQHLSNLFGNPIYKKTSFSENWNWKFQNIALSINSMLGSRSIIWIYKSNPEFSKY